MTTVAKRYVPEDLPGDTVLVCGAIVTIDCPASHVFQIILDTSTWPEWNSFVPKAEIEPPKSLPPGSNPAILVSGSRMTCHVYIKPNASETTSHFLVTKLVTPDSTGSEPSSAALQYRVSWTQMDYPRFLIRQLRSSDCRDIDGAVEAPRCEYKTADVMAGPMVYLVKAMYGNTLQQRFEDHANDLKKYAEKTWSDRNQSKQ